jgi:ribose transport system ATP-binding protein/rhamnose transport system ATP-binding protein
MLVARSIEKSFGRTRVLSSANLTLKAGEIHALLGANGAGKSTLSRIVAGHLTRDAGTIQFKSRDVAFRTARDGLRAGISIVMQETSLAPDLSVLDNIFLPRFSMPGRLSRRTMHDKATALLARLGQTGALSLRQDAGSLSAAQRQLVEIAKALALDSEVIIFDEPTASLSPREVDRLFTIIEQLRRDGHAIGFVSHRLEEVLTLTDCVTVLQDGRSVAEALPTQGLNQTELIRLMVGQELGTVYTSRRPDAHLSAPVVLEAAHLAAAPAVQDVSFKLHAGEILGLGGLVGSGRSETVEAIFGLRPLSGGRIRLQGETFRPRRPADALRAGIALVPEDRRRQSIIPDFDVAENLMLGHLGTARGFGLGYRALRGRVRELLDLLEVPLQRLSDASLLNFSGGMQQKIIIARWLLQAPKVLILDEPTKGIDISSRAAIYKILHKVADAGVAILVISSDFEELLGLCERITVISDGFTVADVPSVLLNEEQLTLLAAPRTSMARTQAFLQSLAVEFTGQSFWGLVDEGRLICLADGHARPPASSYLRAGSVVNVGDTAIGPALAGPRGVFVPADGGKAIILDVHTARGHGNGIVGLLLPEDVSAPSVAAVRERVAAAFD